MSESKHILDAKLGNEIVRDALYIARRIGPTKPDDTMVICPVCTSQFRAIPLDVQRQLAFLSAPERGTSRLGSSARELPAAETAESADERESTADSPDRRDAAARVAAPEGRNRKPSDASLGKDAPGRFDEQRLSLEITTETGYLCAKTLAGVISEFDKLNKAIAKDAGCKVETMIENFVRNGNALRIDFVILRASEGKGKASAEGRSDE